MPWIAWCLLQVSEVSIQLYSLVHWEDPMDAAALSPHGGPPGSGSSSTKEGCLLYRAGTTYLGKELWKSCYLVLRCVCVCVCGSLCLCVYLFLLICEWLSHVTSAAVGFSTSMQRELMWPPCCPSPWGRSLYGCLHFTVEKRSSVFCVQTTDTACPFVWVWVWKQFVSPGLVCQFDFDIYKNEHRLIL